MKDLEMLQADGTYKKIGTLSEEAIASLRLFEPKHTPGPWQYLGDPEDGECRVRQTASVRKGDGFIREITICQEVNTEANARLIAQAPTLLADLTDAAAQLRKYETLHRAKGGELSTELADANAALAARFEATIAAAVGGAE